MSSIQTKIDEISESCFGDPRGFAIDFFEFNKREVDSVHYVYEDSMPWWVGAKETSESIENVFVGKPSFKASVHDAFDLFETCHPNNKMLGRSFGFNLKITNTSSSIPKGHEVTLTIHTLYWVSIAMMYKNFLKHKGFDILHSLNEFLRLMECPDGGATETEVDDFVGNLISFTNNAVSQSALGQNSVGKRHLYPIRLPSGKKMSTIKKSEGTHIIETV